MNPALGSDDETELVNRLEEWKALAVKFDLFKSTSSGELVQFLRVHCASKIGDHTFWLESPIKGDDFYNWTTNADVHIECQALLGAGGESEVFQVTNSRFPVLSRQF